MSANRCTTLCACGLWDLATSDGTAAIDDPALVTAVSYFGEKRAGNGGYGMGYGFREQLAGTVYMWRRRDGSGSIVASANHPVEGYEREVAWTYAVPNPEDRYRWKRLQCPLCLRHYAGWYVQQPASLDLPMYELYDSSFYHARNDEPAREDEAEAKDVTPQMLVDAVREYRQRRGAA